MLQASKPKSLIEQVKEQQPYKSELDVDMGDSQHVPEFGQMKITAINESFKYESNFNDDVEDLDDPE